jgi:hypothetical protein
MLSYLSSSERYFKNINSFELLGCKAKRRMPLKKIMPVHCKKCLKIKKILRHNFLQCETKDKFLEYYEESVVKLSAQSEHFSAFVVIGIIELCNMWWEEGATRQTPLGVPWHPPNHARHRQLGHTSSVKLKKHA